MSKCYDYSEVYVTENEVQEMLEGIGYAVQALSDRLDRRVMPYADVIETQEVLKALKRSREIGSQILLDIQYEEDEDK